MRPPDVRARSTESTLVETVDGESPAGKWTFSSWKPPALAKLVDHFWAFTGPTAHVKKRIFPNGCVELLLNFGEPYRQVEGRGNELCRDAWVSGPQTGPIVVEQPRWQDVLGVRLLPAGAYALLSMPMREVTGWSVELADVVGPLAGEIMQRCANARTVTERFRIVATWVADRARQSPGLDPGVAWAVQQVGASGGATAMEPLRTRLGLTKTRFVEAFRDQVGPAPKMYARVVRFRRVLGALQRAPSNRLIDVAMDASFYDQPHMNAEFRALGGVTPREFLATRHPVGDGSTARDVR
ncbi:MAG: AraC family transcriptional regulator [Polyangiaceae bacterium]|nr:AraC family transcriptional regulator [Polyangiaceae bacterium]